MNITLTVAVKYCYGLAATCECYLLLESSSSSFLRRLTSQMTMKITRIISSMTMPINGHTAARRSVS